MLKDLFVSDVRVALLKIMLPNWQVPYHVRALVRAVGTEINAVRRELTNLETIGLLFKRKSGNRVYYSVNTAHIYYPELLSLTAKEFGLGRDIIKHRKRLGDLRFAVLSRRFSKNLPATALDVDLFLVGDVNLTELEKLVFDFKQKLGREVHYSVMTDEEFIFRKRKNDQFVSKILGQGRTMLFGDEEAFCSI